jgi:hypothetical protein
MIPEHYLHIILGMMPGAALGFLAGAAVTSLRHRRRSAERRRTEGRYYPWSSEFAD